NMAMIFIYFNNIGQKKYSQPCFCIDPKQLTIENKSLFDKTTNYSIEQFILELHQDGIID
ncbi:unnamed protein product, partial [Rotaria sp. Silwood2]